MTKLLPSLQQRRGVAGGVGGVKKECHGDLEGQGWKIVFVESISNINNQHVASQPSLNGGKTWSCHQYSINPLKRKKLFTFNPFGKHPSDTGHMGSVGYTQWNKRVYWLAYPTNQSQVPSAIQPDDRLTSSPHLSTTRPPRETTTRPHVGYCTYGVHQSQLSESVSVCHRRMKSYYSVSTTSVNLGISASHSFSQATGSWVSPLLGLR